MRHYTSSRDSVSAAFDQRTTQTTQLQRFGRLATASATLICLLALLLRSNTAPVAATEQARATIEEARAHIARQPFDFVGYAALGELTSASPITRGEGARALAAAKLLAPIDPIVIRSELRSALAQDDAALAMHRAATLLDTSPVDQSDALHALAALSDDARWPAFVAQRLRTDWPAADTLLLFLCEQHPDRNRMLLLSHQITRVRPLSTRGSHCVENKLVNAGAIDAAYHLRLVATAKPGKHIDFIFNGDFEQLPSGSPFDWLLATGGAYRAGFEVSFRGGSDDGRSGGKLVARFNGRAVSSPLAQQYLALIPGRYRIVTHSAETGFNAKEAPRWVLRCVAQKATQPELKWVEQLDDRRWIKRSATFSIEPECSGQLLSFEVVSRLNSLEGLRGTAVIDSIRLERI